MKNFGLQFQRLFQTLLAPAKREAFLELVPLDAAASYAAGTTAVKVQMRNLLHQSAAKGRPLHLVLNSANKSLHLVQAQWLAQEMKQPLYRVNLAAVISKYIGETEKNLRLVFSRAEKMGAVLLFDEADALLGKRSNVRDAHDKYANQEVAYLLQKMETYPHHIFVQCKNGDCIGVLPGFVLLGN